MSADLQAQLQEAERRIKELEGLLRDRAALACLAHAERERKRVGPEEAV